MSVQKLPLEQITVKVGGRIFTYDEIVARDKTSLDITWLKD
jgi:hypothetical protein